MQWEPHIQAGGLGSKPVRAAFFFFFFLSQKSGAAAAVPVAPPPTALLCEEHTCLSYPDLEGRDRCMCTCILVFMIVRF